MVVGEVGRRLETPVRAAPVSVRRDWIVAPAFDLIFFANLGWLLALLPFYLTDDGQPHIGFWQIYFLTTPHRWITLALVALDPDRRAGRGSLLVMIAVGLGALVAGITLVFDGFVCLLLIDYLWNGWHFAS